MLRVPRATYRLQLGPQCDFAAATRLVDYLHELGISHMYASPCLQAVRGSEHGYDVVDHARVRDELGGEAGFARLCSALHARGMGLLLDIVPNHMAIGSAENALWWDVLENGPASRFAMFFDVDWDATADNRVLRPILSERYVEALEQGLLRITREGARVIVCYREHTLPAAPRSLARPLERAARAQASDELAQIAADLHALPSPWATDRESTARRQRDKRALFERLQDLLERQSQLARAVDAELQALSATPETFDAWLEQQNWRISYWRAAVTELGYRRFFDVQTLVGLRMEDPEVFAITHARVLEWLSAGQIDGVRIDHPDGLRDPEQYLQRLHASAPRTYVVVEKILQAGETLRPEWPVAGSTGYEFIRLQDQLQVQPDGLAKLRDLATRIAGGTQDWEPMVRTAKLQVLNQVLASERARAVEHAHRVLRSQMATRDCTWAEVGTAVTELLASYDAYRSYVRVGQAVSDADRTLICSAVARAKVQHPELAEQVWSVLQDALLLRIDSDLARDFALSMQQLTGAVTAKAVEDTVFYRHVVLIALNEVGGAPHAHGTSIADFHRAMQAQSAHGMLAATTHDTKRGEDMRSRLLLLTEIPDAWEVAVTRWLELGARYAASETTHGVDPATQLYVYQTLVGAHPLSEERAQQHMLKAIREAKRHTSWSAPNADHEAAVARFVSHVFEDVALQAEIQAFVARIERAGCIASLGKTLVRLTVPGVPDIYQGSELWELRLVDPDNRGPVDFAQRRALLERTRGQCVEAVWSALDDGSIKQWLIAKTLALRAAEPELFEGAYTPLEVSGPEAEAVLSYARGDSLVVIVPRWPLRAQTLSEQVYVKLPLGTWHEVLGGDVLHVTEPGLAVRRAWSRLPVALLRRPA